MAILHRQRSFLSSAAVLTTLAVGLIFNVNQSTARAGDDVKLTGAGSTFVQPLFEKWSSEYSKSHPNVTISYNGIGSGGGIKQITAKEVDFGASDAPMSPAELKKAQENGQDLIHLPTTLGAVVVIYNVPGIDVNTSLKFSGPVLADVFSGKIRKWNDARIKELNPDVAGKLPDAAIKVVHRDDPSGTTYIFTDFLSKVAKDWKAGKSSDHWPSDSQAGKGNPRVADAVKASTNTIGYVELNYALSNHLAYGDVQNAAGKFIHPSIESVSAAANLQQVPDDLSKLSTELTNGPAAEGYPITGTTFVLLPKQIGDSAKGKALIEFLNWGLHDGQALSKNLYYSPLPDNIAAAAEAKLKQVSAGGKRLE